MYTKMTPLFDRVVIEMAPEKDNGKIITPDKYKMPSNEGLIVATGNGRYDSGILVPMTVKVGDTVLVQELRGIDFHLDGKVLRIVEEGAIMAIVERSTLVTAES